MSVGLVGVGYEGLSLESFVSRLRIHSVSALVDVRLNAISRKPGFSKRALSSALEEAGIAYLHRPALGNQRDNRAGYSEIGTRAGDEARSTFRHVLTSEGAAAALDELVALASSQKVAVFCFEADEHHCHREQVLEAAQGRSLVTA